MSRFSTSRTGVPAVTVAAVLMLGIEAFGLSHGTFGAGVVVALFAVVALFLSVRLTLRTAGLGAALGAAFFTSWNGFLVGPVRPGDLLIFVAFACFIAADTRSRLPTVPWWVAQVGAVIVVVAILHVLIPTDPTYLAGRVVVAGDGTPYVENQSNLGVAFKFLTGIVLLPLVFCFAAKHDRRSIRWLAIAFTAGVSVSGLVAFSDGRGLTHLGSSLTGAIFPLSRQAGFTNHPNFLAAGCVLATSIAIWLAASAEFRIRVIGWATLPGVLLGNYATGSRGGAVAGVLAVVLCVCLLPNLRKHLASIGFLAGLVVTAAFVASPGLGSKILSATRLGGDPSATAGSDYLRSLVGSQAIRDLHFSPIDGIGLQVAAEAQNVYLQELAAGGVLLFIAMTLFFGGAAAACLKLMPTDDFARALFISTVSAVVLNYAEANLSDRFFYVPSALIAALVYRHRMDTVSEQSEDAAESAPPVLVGSEVARTTG